MWPFSDFQYGFRSSQSTANVLTVVSDRIARASNSSGATRAAALDLSKAFDRVGQAGLLHRLMSYGISGQIFFLNWDSLRARLNSHYEAWSYKKKKHERVKAYRKQEICLERTYS